MSPVTLSDQSRAIAALEAEKATLFREAAGISEVQQDLLRQFRRQGERHSVVLARSIAIEEAQSKLVMPL